MNSPLDPDQSEIEESAERQLRAGTYSLLAALLRSPPDSELLARLDGIEAQPEFDDPDSIATAWTALRQAARQADLKTLNDEYHTLFIGIGRGELVPYGSWYLTGFLMEKPLGDLRRNLAALGYQRQEHVREPEDHVSALCEAMALLILDNSMSLEVQRKFFATHLDSWMGRFFQDLNETSSTDFYRSVGRLGSSFIKLEKQYLSMLV